MHSYQLIIYGSGGATPELKLEKGDEKFERGTVDIFVSRLGLDTKAKEMELAGILMR